MAPKALYGELAEYYDRVYSFKDYEAEVAELTALIRRLGPSGGSRLLDVGCGTGHHLELFRRQFRVAGLDASPAMLRVARRRLGKGVPLFLGDMRSFALDSRFDVIVCLFSAIGYLLTREDRDRAARAFFRHLRPGGVLLVEGWVRPERWRDRSVHLLTYDGADVKIARASSTRRKGNRSYLDMQYLVAVPGQPIRHFREHHVNALIGREELLGSFRRAGFRARVRMSGRYRDRGLYIGVRPALPGPRAAARQRSPASVAAKAS